MANAWVEHVRKWAKDHDLSYMCAATEPAAREAYYKGIPPEKKKAAKKMNKTIGELKEKYPAYAEMKSQRAEQQQMMGEERNVLKIPRPASNMIPVANVEIPEPVTEPKRVVVGKTIRVRKPKKISELKVPPTFEQRIVTTVNSEKYPKLAEQIYGNLPENYSFDDRDKALYYRYIDEGVPEDEIRFVISENYRGGTAVSEKDALKVYKDIENFIRIGLYDAIQQNSYFSGWSQKRKDKFKSDAFKEVLDRYKRRGFWAIIKDKSWGNYNGFPPPDFWKRVAKSFTI